VDLDWWSEFLSVFNGKTFLVDLVPVPVFYPQLEKGLSLKVTGSTSAGRQISFGKGTCQFPGDWVELWTQLATIRKITVKC